MKGHLDAIAARMPHDTYLVQAPPNTLPPYFILEPSGLSVDDDRAIAASDPSLAFDVRVKAVGGTPGGSLIMAGNAKDELSPDGAPTALTVTGRRADVIHVRFESAYTDDSVTIPGTNRHPAVVVETYQVWSSPTA